MDIQISSNFERLLFDATKRDTDAVRAMMGSLRQSGSYDLPERTQKIIKSEFDVGMATEPETLQMMKSVHAQSGYLLDPHTALARHVARKYSTGETPMITLATAHASKFPAAVQKATGVYPELPYWIENLMEGKEHLTALENDQAEVESFILGQYPIKLNRGGSF